MTVNELRLGNIVLDKLYGCNVIITKYFFTEGNVNSIEPIALTEEILLKIKGIKQEGLTFRIGKYILWYYNGESYSFMLYNEKDDLPDDLKVYSVELAKVKYLHQLQNVFYSLENEELEINL